MANPLVEIKNIFPDDPLMALINKKNESKEITVMSRIYEIMQLIIPMA